MKKLLILLALFATYTTQAQSRNQNYDPSRVTGQFFIKQTTAKGVEKINVNYYLSPAPFTKVLNFSLNTPQPRMLSAKITNSSGRTVLTWKPQAKDYRYETEFNIATLQPGNYNVNVYDAGGVKLYSIPFSKSKLE
ncbi:MAG: hypothetical protein JSS96_13820 [Bacteroidetes bacterium]|nr:hypothetical protein [Bacteroidota bacterium]